ncbi:MAG: hypothetical protein V3W41_19130 [Planctomycetota bacterium]
MLKSRLLLVVLMVTMGIVPTWAQEATKDATKQSDLESTIKNAIDELAALESKFDKKLRAMPRNEQRAYYNENQPDAAPFIARVKKAVSANSADPAAAAGLNFLIQRSQRGDDKTKAWASDLALKHHRNDAKCMGTVIGGCERDYSVKSAGILESLGTHRDSQIAIPALFSKIERLKSLAGAAKRFGGITDDKMKKGWIDHFGDDVIASFTDVDSAKTESKAETMLRALAKNPDLAKVKYRRGTYADAVNDKLFVLDNLAVGKKAPEILGTDVDGTEFKLSDYRGKAVLLDFWGHW